MEIGLLISVVIAVYLVIDAPKHNKSPVLWGILGFLLGPLALGIYFIQTGRQTAGWIITILTILFYVVIVLLIVFAASMVFFML